jgi:hypothetical protein
MSYMTARICSLSGRILLTATCLACLLSTIEAYTIVMRDGRRIEIPAQFTIGDATLTYEVSPGIQVTLQVVSIDTPATEETNNEPDGSFLVRRLTRPTTVSRKSTGTRRSITNKDLEGFKRTRERSEVAYEQRRRELGLPSLAEARKVTAAQTEAAQEIASNQLIREQDSENYWRERASSLRTDFIANEARIEYVRKRLDELPLSYSAGAFTTLSPFITVDQLAIRPSLGQPITTVSSTVGPFTRGNVFGGVRRGTRRGVDPFGARVGMNPWRFPGARNRQYRPLSPYGSLVAVPFDSLDNSYERSELATELNRLLANRAEFQARWRELEDEARRAGAYPGWLRE